MIAMNPFLTAVEGRPEEISSILERLLKIGIELRFIN